MASLVQIRGVVVPTPNLVIVVVARDDVAVTENIVPTAARPAMLRLVVVASVLTNLVANKEVEVALVLVLLNMSSHVIVEVALFASIAPVNCASTLTASAVVVASVATNLVANSDVDVALVLVLVIIERFVIVELAAFVTIEVLMVVTACTVETTANTPATTARVIANHPPSLINENPLFIQ